MALQGAETASDTGSDTSSRRAWKKVFREAWEEDESSERAWEEGYRQTWEESSDGSDLIAKHLKFSTSSSAASPTLSQQVRCGLAVWSVAASSCGSRENGYISCNLFSTHGIFSFAFCRESKLAS